MQPSLLLGRASEIRPGAPIIAGPLGPPFSFGPLQVVSLIVGDTPVQFSPQHTLSIREGDKVAAVGDFRGPALKALAMRNYETNVTCFEQPDRYINLAFGIRVVCVVIGLTTLRFFGLGILPILLAYI